MAISSINPLFAFCIRSRGVVFGYRINYFAPHDTSYHSVRCTSFFPTTCIASGAILGMHLLSATLRFAPRFISAGACETVWSTTNLYLSHAQSHPMYASLRRVPRYPTVRTTISHAPALVKRGANRRVAGNATKRIATNRFTEMVPSFVRPGWDQCTCGGPILATHDEQSATNGGWDQRSGGERGCTFGALQRTKNGPHFTSEGALETVVLRKEMHTPPPLRHRSTFLRCMWWGVPHHFICETSWPLRTQVH